MMRKLRIYKGACGDLGREGKGKKNVSEGKGEDPRLVQRREELTLRSISREDGTS